MYTVVFQPNNLEVQVAAGSNLMEVLNEAKLPVDFPCGGNGKCGKCSVKINNDIQLACKTKVNANLNVELLQGQQTQHNILVGSEIKVVELQPHLHKVLINVDKPSLEDARSDVRRLQDSIDQGEVGIPLNLIRQLPEILPGTKELTAVVYGNQVTALEEQDTTNTMYGMAFDIGTTTIVGYLMDLKTGQERAVVSCLNPQTKYGADVISRVTFTRQTEDGLERLQQLVVTALNQLIKDATDEAGLSTKDVYAVTIAANTCMHHLFVGISPRSIATAPYIPVVSEPMVLGADELGVAINPGGQIFVLPNIAGFVGADTTAVLLATELEQSPSLKLMLDIGTNGEIALGSKEKIVTCSAAAGPAFEGAQISSGMRGAVGAIDHVYFGEQLTFSVIGGVKPIGICGSALLDAVAGMVEFGLVNRKGKILAAEQLTEPRALAYQKRLIQYEGEGAFLLEEADATGHGRPIMITQDDIRQLQLAKGAMAAGVRVLLEVYGAQVEDVEEVLLAGAFGNYLDPRSACLIGLIPQELESKVRLIGNAAGTGAKLALLSASEYRRAAAIAQQVQFVELGSYAKFNRIFAESMYFKTGGQ